VDNFQWILAYDGDKAGRLVGRAILSNNLNALSEVSERINLGHEIVKRWATYHGGSVISGGGDEGTFQVPHEALAEIEQLRKDYHFATQLTMSVGVGKTLSEAGKSLLAAKFRGKDQVVFYDPTVEEELHKVKSNLEQGTASEEEKKQGEAYLKPEGQGENMDTKEKTITKAETPDEAQGQDSMFNSEQPMDEIISNEHDCPYCQELAAQNIHDEDCPYCAAIAPHDPMADGHPDDCPYCAVMNHDPAAPDHAADCPYCQEMAMHDPTVDGHPDDCPYCARSHDPAAEGHPDDCQYCARAGAAAGGDDQTITPSNPPTDILPTTQDSQNYLGQDMARPSLDKPAAISSQPSRAAMITDSKTNQNIILEDTQGGPANQEYRDYTAGSGVIGTTSTPENSDTTQSIRDEIEALPTDQVPLRAEGQTDDANLQSGTNMEGNVSRPESYSQGTPTDLGLGEQPENKGPDITSVLQEGLDNHADNIKRERVVEMVGEALQGFKASKMIIERAKTEAPQLYQSSIAMLRAMIEMCKMLGLDQDQAIAPSGVVEESPNTASPVESTLQGQQDTPSAGMPSSPPNDPYGEGEQESNDGHPDYNNLFPTHPESGGGSTDPKLRGR
jgi:hypothetical protein